MLLSDLFDKPVRAPRGEQLGRVVDVRFRRAPRHGRREGELELIALIVSPHGRLPYYGYERGTVKGPAVIAAIMRWLHRGSLIVPWEFVARVDEDAVMLESAAPRIPLDPRQEIALASCTAGPEPAPSPSVTESNLGVLGVAGCSPPSPSLGSEVQGTGSDGVTAYGLTFGPEPDAITSDGSTVKMVVRMTGSGEVVVHLIAPSGAERPLDWGPEVHGGSNFRRPGDEWGIGFSSDAPGCWQLTFERGESDRADFWFDVRE